MSGVKGWRIDDEVAEQVKDYARIRRISVKDAATHLLRKALIAEMDADPALAAAMKANQDVRQQ